MIPLAKQPAYLAATQQLNDLNAALVKVTGRIAEIDAQLASFAPQEDRDEARAAAALEFAQTGVVTPVALIDDLQQEHLSLRQQAESLQKVITARLGSRDQLAQQLSAEAWQQAKPAHDRLAARYVEQLQVLDALHLDEMALLRSFEQLGYDVTLQRRVHWFELGVAADPNSLMGRRVREFTV